MFHKFIIGSAFLHVFFLIGAGLCLPKIPVFEDKPVYFEIETIRKNALPDNNAPMAINTRGNEGNGRLTIKQSRTRSGKVIRTGENTVAHSPAVQTAVTPRVEKEPAKPEEKAGQKPVAALETTTSAPNVNNPKPTSNSQTTESPNRDPSDSNSVSHPGTSSTGNGTSNPLKNPDAKLGNGAGSGTGSETATAVSHGVNQSGASNGVAGENKTQSLTRPPLKLFCPKPAYPEKARQKNWEGVVGLRILVKADGTVGEVTVLQSSNYLMLDQEAVKTVKSWRYQPAVKDGAPIDSFVKIKFPFKLED